MLFQKRFNRRSSSLIEVSSVAERLAIVVKLSVGVGDGSSSCHLGCLSHLRLIVSKFFNLVL